MKSTEELYNKHTRDATETMKFYKFQQALTEHDAEIKAKIGGLKKKSCLDRWFTKDEVNDILTELLQFIEGGK